MRRWIPIAVAAGVFTLAPLSAGGALGRGSDAAPAPFQLQFVGHTILASYPSPSGAAHVGTFTTNSALCPSGSGQDIAETELGVATRLFTCDGSGATFTATIDPHIGEYTGSGSWQITAGTGALAELRGEGSFSSVLTSGDPSDIPGNLLALSFVSTWSGTAALDATPPSVTLSKDAAVRLRRPAGTYRLSVAFSASSAGGGPVSYTFTIIDPVTLDTLARKSGSTTGGTVAPTYTMKPRGRSLRLEIDVSDEVGNTTTLKRTIALKRS